MAARLSPDAAPRRGLGSSLRVAIAGLGPKGLFALERLLDHARGLDLGAHIVVDIYEPSSVPGAGPVYDPDQPDYLRMNFAASQLDMWWPSSRASPGGDRPSFLEWRAGGEDDEYPPRAQVGRYLAHGLETLLLQTPPNVDVKLDDSPVESADRNGASWLLRAGDALRSYDEVLIATGHEPSGNASLVSCWTHAAPLVAGVFPVDRHLSRERVPPGATVAVRGFALTFIDAALALTEGRGGSFEPQEDHPYRLRYLPGPDEVRLIVPFARTGRPVLAKPAASLAARIPALGPIAADGRARIAGIGGAVDLHGELLPLLAATVSANLAAATGATVERHARVAVGRRLAEAAGGGGDSGELAAVAAIEQSLRVGAGLATPDMSWTLGHTWRSLYPALVARLGGDGLQTRDWPAFLRLSAEMERIAFGPPPLNAAKLLALVDAGRIDLSFLRAATLASEGGHTALRCARGACTVDVVIDAVLPAPGASNDGGLVGRLVTDGHARVLEGRRGLEVTSAAGCRGRDGSVTPGLSSVGRPPEDSVIGNDTLSRSLHPQADRWARRIVARSRERSREAASREGRRTARA